MTHLTHPRPHSVTPAPADAPGVPSQEAAGTSGSGGQDEYPKTEQPEMLAMLDALSDIVCVTTCDGTLRFLNRAGRDLLGYVDDDAALVGSLFPTHTTAARQLLLDEVVPTALRHGSATCDTALQTADGRIFPASQTVIVTPSRTGGAPTLTIVIRDVSIERQAAARLGESQRLFEMITRSSPDLIYLYDPIDERIVWMNRCAYAFLGGAERDARTLSRREMHRLVHPDDRIRFRAAGARMAAAYGDSDVLTTDVRMACDGGAWRWMHTRASVFSRRETGAPLLILGIASDFTAERGAEQQLTEALEAAEHTAEVRNGFLARVSVEFRDALHGIISAVSTVRADRDHRLTAHEHAQLDALIAHGTDLLGTVSDLLDFTRVEAGDMPVQQQRTDVRDVLRETVASFVDHPRRADVPIELEVPPAAAPILVDPHRLRQALSHLVAHAIDVTAHGRVTVALRPTDAGDQPLAIDVCDSGPDLDEAARQDVFTPFSGRHRVTHAGLHGGRDAGMGLALARALCEMIGCALTLAHSEPGAGSTFRITLPVPSRAARLAAEFPVA